MSYCQNCADLEARLAEVEAERDAAQSVVTALDERLFDVKAERDAAEFHLEDARTENQKLAGRLAAVEALCDQAEAGGGIVITPGFSTFYAVETGRLRAALHGEGERPAANCKALGRSGDGCDQPATVGEFCRFCHDALNRLYDTARGEGDRG